jgi:hypothetical protein
MNDIDRAQRIKASNRRTGWSLALLALFFFVLVIARHVWFN